MKPSFAGFFLQIQNEGPQFNMLQYSKFTHASFPLLELHLEMYYVAWTFSTNHSHLIHTFCRLQFAGHAVEMA